MKTIWYISKYALGRNQNGPSRQFLFSYHFAKLGYPTYLISSNSNGFKHIDFKGNHKLQREGNLRHYILKGGEINLGLSLKRIFSWFLFEIRVLKFFYRRKISSNDVVIVSSLSILTFLTGIYLKRKHKVRLIIEVRDIWPLTLVEFRNMKKYNPIILFLSIVEKLAYKNADYIVGTMGNLKKHIKNISPGNETKFHYIPMGFDDSVFKDNYTLNNKNESKEKEFIVGYAGTIGEANKVDLILESAKLLSKKKNIKFKILGDGVKKSNFEKKYKELENVEFLPKVEKKNVVSFLRTCDVLLNPWEDYAMYEFGVSPNKWIDYMYSAKPIIIPFNGYRNIINEAKCGVFIETNNSDLLAKKILDFSFMDKNKLKRMGQNGKEYLLKELNYSVLSRKYENLFF